MKLLISHFILAISLISAEDCIEKIVVFGDSFSDTGNVKSLTGGAVPPGPPYNDGRFTNGLTWIDHLADFMNMDRPMPAYARPMPVYAPESAGTNFAIAGASSGNEETTTWIPALTKASITLPSKGLRAQIEDFLLQDEEDKCSPEFLFVIWVGAVDLLMLNKGPEYDDVIKNIKKGIKSLISGGATKLLVLNLPQLAKTPAAVGKFTSLFISDTIPSGLADSVNRFNDGLKEMLEVIGASNDDVKITCANILPLFKKVAKNPSDFGLDTSKDIGKPRLNEKKLFVKGKVQYQNEENTLWFDGVHPTTVFHKILATEVYELVEGKKNSKSKKTKAPKSGSKVPKSKSIKGHIVV